MNIYNTFVEPVVSLFLPALCIHCNNSLPAGRRIICENCYQELLPIPPNIFERIKKTFVSGQIDEIHVLFQFTPLFQELIHLLKYQRYLTIAEYFAGSLAQSLSGNHYDCITAVPLNPIRYRERGYNQSFLLAARCAEIMQIEFSSGLLTRKRNTQSQTKLSRKERIENIQNAFFINGDVKNKKLLIIDDVITTGSTLNECAGVLKNFGAGSVHAAAIATPLNIPQLLLEDELEQLEIL